MKNRFRWCLGAVLFGVALSVTACAKKKPAEESTGGTDTGSTNSTSRYRTDAERTEARERMKQLMLAVWNYHDSIGRFPSPGVASPIKSELSLSWRVHLLPYVEQGNLFQAAVRLDEPWDGPSNKALLDMMPDCFKVPGTNPPKGYTHYRIFLGEADDRGTYPALFTGLTQHRTIPDLRDGTSVTLFLVEADEAVPWTKPEGIPYRTDKPLTGVGKLFSAAFCVGMADGSVVLMPRDTPEPTLRRLISPSDGEPVELPK